MTTHRFDVHPWGVGWSCLRNTGWEDRGQSHRESVFSLSNGQIGWRGTLDEGDPSAAAGSYLNGVFEEHPMPYAEDGYGYPEHGQTVMHVPDGKVIRLIVDDEPFDIRTGELAEHRQLLDVRTGILHRTATWTSPAGRTVTIASQRMVSFTHRSIAAVRYEVTAEDAAVDVTLLSEIVADEPLPEVHSDPRVMDALRDPFEPVAHHGGGGRATLVQRTRRSRIAVAVAGDSDVWAGLGVDLEPEHAVAAELGEVLGTPDEIAAAEGPGGALTRLFCAKEAIQKALWPRGRVLLEFRDVTLTRYGDCFAGRVMRDAGSVPAGTVLRGEWTLAADHLLAAVFWDGM